MYQKKTVQTVEGMPSELDSHDLYEVRVINLQTAREQAEAQRRVVEYLVDRMGQAGINTTKLRVLGFGSAREGLGVRGQSDMDIAVIIKFDFGESTAMMMQVNELITSLEFRLALATASGVLDAEVADHINIVIQGQSLTTTTQAIIESIPLSSDIINEDFMGVRPYLDSDSLGGD